jgi:hypothetical protein
MGPPGLRGRTKRFAGQSLRRLGQLLAKPKVGLLTAPARSAKHCTERRGGGFSRCPIFETRRWAAQFYFGDWTEPLVIFKRTPPAPLALYLHRLLPVRSHAPLDKDCPSTRPIQTLSSGEVIAVPQVGGLHHRRRACWLIRVGVRLQRQPPSDHDGLEYFRLKPSEFP